MLIVYTIIMLILFLVIPKSAYAWGPGMHTFIGLEMLSKLALFAPVIRDLLKKYPQDFMYGAVSPDIIVGKKYAGLMHHCHNWQVGMLILSEANKEHLQAAAYGYLTHLASDIVAHNYYIPFKIIRSYKTKTLSHAYWEMRFDLGVPDEIWSEVNNIVNYDSNEFDLLLNRVLRKTIFSFKTNKRIFSSILALQKMRGIRKSLKLYSKKSQWDIEKNRKEHYIDLSLGITKEFLINPKEAHCLELDPTGIPRLTYAKNLRRRMKALRSRGILNDSAANMLLELVRERLAQGLYKPELVLPDVTDVFECRRSIKQF